MDKHEAFERLVEINEELIELGREAKKLVKEHFPDRLPAAEAYGVFDFGRSCNPYDSTFDKLVGSIEKHIDDDEEDDEDKE